MSFEAMAWAVKWDLPVKLKITLIMLADRINKDTGRCHPSIAGLARDCGMSETSVREAIRSLKDAGLVVAHERKIDGVSLTNEYGLETSKFPPPLRNTPHPPAPHAPPPLRNTHPNLLDKPINEPDAGEEGLFSQDEAPEVDGVFAKFDQFWKAFPSKPNTSKKNAMVKFVAALKRVSFDDLMRATRAYAASRAGEDSKFTKAAEFWLNGEFWSAWLTEEIDPQRARLRNIIAEAQAAEANTKQGKRRI